MSDVVNPTAEDMKLDPAALLRECGWAGAMRPHVAAGLCRRVIAAEDHADLMRNTCHMLVMENRDLRDDVKGVIERECESLAAAASAAAASEARVSAAAQALLPVLHDLFDGVDAVAPLVGDLEDALHGRPAVRLGLWAQAAQAEGGCPPGGPTS